MRRARRWLARLLGPVRNVRSERDIDIELQSHLQLHIADNIRAGMTPDVARRQAWMALGGIERTKDEYRDQRGFPMLESFSSHDLAAAHRRCRNRSAQRHDDACDSARHGNIATVTVVVLAVGLLSSLVPAYRATQVDPLQALRAE